MKITNSPFKLFSMDSVACLNFLFPNVCVCARLRESTLYKPTYVWVGDFGCASPAPNHLSLRGQHVPKPIISLQQLLGSSLCFPTMVQRANTHSRTKNDNVCLVLLSAGARANLTITQTLALKTVKVVCLGREYQAFIASSSGRLFSGSEKLWSLSAISPVWLSQPTSR